MVVHHLLEDLEGSGGLDSLTEMHHWSKYPAPDYQLLTQLVFCKFTDCNV